MSCFTLYALYCHQNNNNQSNIFKSSKAPKQKSFTMSCRTKIKIRNQANVIWAKRIKQLILFVCPKRWQFFESINLIIKISFILSQCDVKMDKSRLPNETSFVMNKNWIIFLGIIFGKLLALPSDLFSMLSYMVFEKIFTF